MLVSLFCLVLFMDADVPGPPKELKITDVTRSTMRLIWKLPDNDGGERIKSYFIEKKSLTDKAWTKVNLALSFSNHRHYYRILSCF